MHTLSSGSKHTLFVLSNKVDNININVNKAFMDMGWDPLAQSEEHLPTDLATQVRFSSWKVFCTSGRQNAKYGLFEYFKIKTQLKLDTPKLIQHDGIIEAQNPFYTHWSMLMPKEETYSWGRHHRRLRERGYRITWKKPSWQLNDEH